MPICLGTEPAAESRQQGFSSRDRKAFENPDPIFLLELPDRNVYKSALRDTAAIEATYQE
jgi:hypothetical protein